MDTTGTEDAMWRDAYAIAYLGASNPSGVAATLARHTAALAGRLGTDAAARHPALRAIAGHLDFLFGNSMGPGCDLLDQVIRHAQRLGIYAGG